MSHPAPTLESLRHEVERRVFGLPGWMSCTFVWPSPCDDGHTRSCLRPVALRDGTAYQDTRTGGLAAAVSNYSRGQAKSLVRAMLESDFSEVHVQSADGDFHGRVTRKGRVLVSRSRPLRREAAAPAAHDRAKDYPLDRCGDPRLLQALGFADPDGHILPSMHGKYRQVNEFLRALEATLAEAGVEKSESQKVEESESPKPEIPETRNPETANCELQTANCELQTANCELRTANCELQTANCELQTANCELRTANCELRTANRKPTAAPLRLVDIGCGRAYLSLAARAYFEKTLGRPVELVGVDRRADIVATCRAAAERLELAPPAAAFVAADVADFTPASAPDAVFSLHACDTDTDMALAGGVRWGARILVSAPCCQHEIQKTLRADGPSRALLRHGILRERLADLLADALRAQLLRVLGYRVRVVEFVEPEATGRNLLLRAVKGIRPGAAEAVAEYLALRDEWCASPPLETLLADLLAPLGIHPRTAP